MNIFYNWLKKFWKKLKQTDSVKQEWENIVIGKIIKADKHPNADRLKVCTVDCGDKIRTIVCGGSNVRDDMFVVVAKPGAKVNFGGGTQKTILQSTTIRGVVSDGMLCGADEIDLIDLFPTNQDKEIIDLVNFNVKVGTPLSISIFK